MIHVADANQVPRLSWVTELSCGGVPRAGKEMKVSWQQPSLHKILTRIIMIRTETASSLGTIVLASSYRATASINRTEDQLACNFLKKKQNI